MPRIDQERQDMHSANQSVESLVIANDEIRKSIPRTMPSDSHLIKQQSEDLDDIEHLEDQDLNSRDITASVKKSTHSLKSATRLSETSVVAADSKKSEIDNHAESSSDMEHINYSPGSVKKSSRSAPSDGKATHSKSYDAIAKNGTDGEIRPQSPKRRGSNDGTQSKSSDRTQSFTTTSNAKPETVRFAKSANYVIPSPSEVGGSNDFLADGKSVDASYASIANADVSHADDWPGQELSKKSPGNERKQKLRLPGSDDEEKPKKSRSRGKSDVGVKMRRPTGKGSGVIEALDLEEMDGEKRAKIRRDSKVESEFGSRDEFKRSPPQQKSKKSKNKGKIVPESDDPDDEGGYNSDGAKMGSKHQKKRPSPPQMYQQANGSPPMIHNQMQPNYQQMVMYGYRPQDQFQFPPQPYGNFIQPDFMMQQPVWNNQPNPGQWMHPVMTPQNFNPYQYFPPNQTPSSAPAILPIAPQVPIPEKDNAIAKISPPVATVNQQEESAQQVVLTPKPPVSSPPARAKSPRKVDIIPVESNELASPVNAILAELPDPAIQIQQQTKQNSADESAVTAEKEAIVNENNATTTSALAQPGMAQVTSDELASAAPPAIRQNAIAPPIPYIVSQEAEQQRLAAMHSLGILNTEDHPRLSKITQMTSRLLGRSCCVLSLVDTDKVIWKSVSPPVTTVKEEPRYESFCSWVVQDESGRGVTVLDSKTDPRCTHFRVKHGLEFYAGVPVTLGGKHKIGALSIQGPPSAQISVIDMNILHEMAVWASGELDTILMQKTLQDREMYIQARDRLGELATNAKSSDKPADSRSMEKSLGLIRTALRAHCVLLLKLSPDSKGFISTLQAYSFDPAIQKSGTLLVGEEMFKELCSLTLKKESGGESALLLENLKTGPVTKDVDHYLSKKINKCMSELLWSGSGPAAVIAAFFDYNYRTISKEEFSFIKNIVPTLSSIYDSMELKDSFQQASNISKNVGASLKKYAVTFGKQLGLAPCLVMIEPRLESFKGYEKVGSTHELEQSPIEPALDANRSDIANQSGPKGQAVGQVLAQKQESSPGSAIPQEVHRSNSKYLSELTPTESFDILNDFTQMVDSLADKFSLKRPKRLGLQYYLFANYGQDTGTLANAASFAHEIFFALDTYNQNKKKSLKTRVGIHLDFVSAELAQDSSALKDQLLGLVNGAYQLESKADSILTSELFYHQTKQYCSYENSPYPIVVRGQGAFSTYRLIGITQEVLPVTEPVPLKENGVNDGASLITSIVPSPISEEKSLVDPVNGASSTNPASSPKQSPSAAGSKKFRCSIM